MLYHISSRPGLKVLRPAVSSHGKPYVYAVENLAVGLLFGAKHDDFDFIIDADGDGTPTISECYPGAFSLKFKGFGCFIYELEEDGFQRGVTGWDPELVCEKPVTVRREIAVPDLYDRLLEEEARGGLRIVRYVHSPDYRRQVAEHIVDRMIRFELDLCRILDTDPRFSRYYRQIVEAMLSAMDGHLLE